MATCAKKRAQLPSCSASTRCCARARASKRGSRETARFAGGSTGSLRERCSSNRARRARCSLCVRDASFLYEIELRDGAPKSATRTTSDGSFQRGREVFAALLGVRAGRFVVPTRRASRAERWRASLENQLARRRARARGAAFARRHAASRSAPREHRGRSRHGLHGGDARTGALAGHAARQRRFSPCLILGGEVAPRSSRTCSPIPRPTARSSGYMGQGARIPGARSREGAGGAATRKYSFEPPPPSDLKAGGRSRRSQNRATRCRARDSAPYDDSAGASGGRSRVGARQRARGESWARGDRHADAPVGRDDRGPRGTRCEHRGRSSWPACLSRPPPQIFPQ